MHGPARSQGVGADSGRVISGIEEAGEDNTFPEGASDLCGRDVCSQVDKTQWETGIPGVEVV
jgi:hypothetical protein